MGFSVFFSFLDRTEVPSRLAPAFAAFFLVSGALFRCSFFCPLDQPCKTLQTVQVAPKSLLHNNAKSKLKKKVEKTVQI